MHWFFYALLYLSLQPSLFMCWRKEKKSPVNEDIDLFKRKKYMYNLAVERRNQRRNGGTKCLNGFVERYLLIHFHEKKYSYNLAVE